MKNIDAILQAGKSIKGLLAAFNSLFLFVPQCLGGWNTITSGSKKRDGKQSKIGLFFCIFVVLACVALVVVFTTPATSAREETSNKEYTQIVTYDSRKRGETCKVLLKSHATKSGYLWTTCYVGMPSNAPVIRGSNSNDSIRQTTQGNRNTQRESTTRQSIVSHDVPPYYSKPQSIATQPRRPSTTVAYNKDVSPRNNPRTSQPTQEHTTGQMPYWKLRNQLARTIAITLPSGAQCKRYVTGEYGCFPITGQPSHYKWNSYSKGTPLGCDNCEGLVSQKHHQAIDIYAPQHTRVFSVWDGVVIASFYEEIGGNTILIDHKTERLVTVYTHLHYNNVKVGDIVKAGQIIGSVGSTGRTPNNHLHFRIHDTTKEAYQISRWAPLTEYEVVSLAPFLGIRKGNFHGEHLVEYLHAT